MAHLSALSRTPLALLVFTMMFVLLLFAGRSGASEAAEPAPAVAPAAVSQSSVEPSVRVARHRHCVRKSLRMIPRYSGGFVVETFLFINGRSVAQRAGAGALKVSAGRLASGTNSFELISRFVDGRSASVVGRFARCGGR